MLAATALLLLALAPAASIAVVDLSKTPQDAFLEAMRRAPGVKGRALPSAQTAAVVEDAKGLGLDCRVSDDKCLEKLMVLLRADELIAFSFERGSVKLARIGGGPARRAKVKFSAPATTARAAMAALEDAVEPVNDAPANEKGAKVEKLEKLENVSTDGSTDGSTDAKDAPTDVPTNAAKGEPTTESPDPTKTAPGIGISPALAIGVVGASLGVGCGAIAVGVSADLAQQQLDANVADPAQRRPIDEGAYRRGELAFDALAICAIAGLVTAGVGIGLFVTEEAPGEVPAEAARADQPEEGPEPKDPQSVSGR